MPTGLGTRSQLGAEVVLSSFMVVVGTVLGGAGPGKQIPQQSSPAAASLASVAGAGVLEPVEKGLLGQMFLWDGHEHHSQNHPGAQGELRVGVKLLEGPDQTGARE